MGQDMIIDFRLRPPLPAYRDSYAFTIWHTPTPPYHRQWEGRRPVPSSVSGDMDEFVREMRSAGINYGVLIARTTKPAPQGREKEMNVGIDDLLGIIRAYPGLFTGVAAVDPLDPMAEKEIVRARESGLAGICIEPTRSAECLRLNDPRIMHVYKNVEESGLFLLTTLGFNTGKDTSWNDVSYVEEICMACPNMPFVITHACWPHVVDLAAVAMRNPNLYLVPDCYFYFPFISTSQEQIQLYNHLLQDQVLFGSSYPIRGFQQSVEESLALPWLDEAREKFLWKNAARLLHLTISPDGSLLAQKSESTGNL